MSATTLHRLRPRHPSQPIRAPAPGASRNRNGEAWRRRNIGREARAQHIRPTTARLVLARIAGCSSATTATATSPPARRSSSASSRSRASSPAATSAAASRSTTSIQVASLGLLKAIDRFEPERADRVLVASRCRRSSASSSGTSATRAGPCACRATCRSWPCGWNASPSDWRASSVARRRRRRSPSELGITHEQRARGARGGRRLPRRLARPPARRRRGGRGDRPSRSASRTPASASPRTRPPSSG